MGVARIEMRPLRSIADPNADSRVDPYDLRELGERAARMFLLGSGSANDAVAEVIRQSGKRLNNHHIQRVVEYANLKAFRELRLGGTGGEPVRFERGPASAVEVIHKVRGSTKEAAVSARKDLGGMSNLVWRADTVLSRQMAKEASGGRVDTDQEVDVVDLYIKLGQALEQCRTSAAILEEKCASQLHEIVRNAAQLIRDGNSLGDVSRVVLSASRNHPGYEKIAMDAILSRVGPLFRLKDHTVEDSLEKVGSAQPNPNHPLFTAVEKFVKLSEELAVKRGAAEVLRRSRARLSSCFRSPQ